MYVLSDSIRKQAFLPFFPQGGALVQLFLLIFVSFALCSPASVQYRISEEDRKGASRKYSYAASLLLRRFKDTGAATGDSRTTRTILLSTSSRSRAPSSPAPPILLRSGTAVPSIGRTTTMPEDDSSRRTMILRISSAILRATSRGGNLVDAASTQAAACG